MTRSTEVAPANAAATSASFRGIPGLQRRLHNLSLTEEALSSWPAERLFDGAWAATTVQRALRGLCEECESKGRRRVFEVLSPYLSAERDDLSYAALATKLRVPESFVKKLLHGMRQRYRVLLRQEVRQTVADPAEVDEELRHLCGTLAASSAYAA